MPVYQKILEFYKVAFDILTKKGARLILKLVVEKNRLPEIVEDFLQYVDNLRKLVEKATFEIVRDIENMLYDYESKICIRFALVSTSSFCSSCQMVGQW